MTTQESLNQILLDSPLSETTKDFFRKKIAIDGATEENINALRELLHATKQQLLADMGIPPNLNDPAIKAAHATMVNDIQAASEKYIQTMKRLETESTRLAEDIQEDLKHLEKIVIASAQAEA